MRLIYSIVLSLLFFTSLAQTKQWVFLDETKCNNCVEEFSTWLLQENITEENQSNWLNAITVSAVQVEIEKLETHPWVKSIEPVRSLVVEKTKQAEKGTTLSAVLEQINAQAFKDAGLNGKGVKVGVIDAGFVNADSSKYFRHLQKGGQIIDIVDFVDPDRTDFYVKKTAGCGHGHEVLKRITGFDDEKEIKYGVASGASFYLARTENGDKEQRIEEDNWVAALEWMHERGVRLVNTSLGYATDFDDPDENYITLQMNGKTSKITKAAQIGIKEKGMIIVVSAGNMGSKTWRIVTAPGDAEEVITVGATKKKEKSKIGYSSIGADFVDYIKPDVSCYSPSGTSYSAPVITGMVACMLQKNPNLTCKEVKEILVKSSHLFPFSNNYLGYGVPNAERILSIMQEEMQEPESIKIQAKGKKVVSVQLPKSIEHAVLFNKKDEWRVLEQRTEKVKTAKSSNRKKRSKLFYKEGGKLYLKVYRQPDFNFTTVQGGDKVVEIEW